jgi:hypothetical protein
MISAERSIKKNIAETSNLKMISGILRTRCSYSVTMVFRISAILVTALGMMNEDDHYVHLKCVTEMGTINELYLHLKSIQMSEDVARWYEAQRKPPIDEERAGALWELQVKGDKKRKSRRRENPEQVRLQRRTCGFT